MKTFLKFTFVMLLTSLLMACGDSLTWTEDVKLPDGRVITLKRYVELTANHVMGDTPNESKQRFEFKHPDTGAIVVWENNHEDGRLHTIALLIDHGTPMLLSQPAYGDDAFKFDCPNPPYLLFEYVSGRWRGKPLANIPVKTIRSNLTAYVKEKRIEIEANEYRLSTAQTLDSYTYFKGVHKMPFIINFEGMPPQSFAQINCSRPIDINKLILGTN